MQALKIPTDKSQHIFVSRHQSAGQNYTLLIANKSNKNVA